MKPVLEIIMVVCFISTSIGLFMGIQESLFIRKISKLKISQLSIGKKAYCQMAINWCHENLAEKKTKKPIIQLRYYKHQKLGGFYLTKSNECVIYVNDELNLRKLTNTIIHEYIHARQREKNFEKMYNRYQREIGYDKNPFEIEARKVSLKYEKECMIDVYKKIYQA